MKPWVVMRCHNDAWIVEQTLQSLARQATPHRLIAFDNESQDGSTEIMRRYTDRIVNIPRGQYVPGKVLNQAMRETDGDVVVFVNSDCVPQNDQWLGALLEPFSDPQVSAVFGRQTPRPECWPLFAKDTEDTFGDGSRQRFWKHCFSMATSAVRRSVWEKTPFREDIQYSEDVDWTWRIRQAGHAIKYAQHSIAMHSHNYTLKQFRKRQFGEGKADAQIFDWTPWESTLLRYSVMPFVRQVIADVRFGLRTGKLSTIVHTLPLRFIQMVGRRQGFIEGLKARRP